MYKERILFIIFNLLVLGALDAQLSIELIEHRSGFNRPVDIDHAGDDRLFVTEQNGKIKVIDASGQLLATPLIDLGLGFFGGGNEQGLLSLAFHPDHTNNGYFFINYTDANGDTVVERYKVKADNPNEADLSSKSEIMKVTQPFNNHNGGDMNFGPDGYLYIALGDGGSANDPQGNSQKRTTLLGKMLRIDINVESGYAIPPDNPFAMEDFTLDEIWALGLRNPWRFSFDQLTGDMWIGDVGQDEWEEIDYQPGSSTGGENYGWKCFEGNELFSSADPCTGNPEDYTAPLQQYESKSSSDGCSVTGGYVYRGANYPDLYGHYIYADYCSGKFWSLSRNCDSSFVNQFLIQRRPFEYSGFGEDVDGELYVAALNEGKIYKITAELCSSFELCFETTDESCIGAKDGMVELRPVRGTAPYEYQVAPSDGFENLTGGNYMLQVTDGNECTDAIQFTIGTSELPDKPIISSTDNGDGNIRFSTVPNAFAYQWYLDDQILEGATDSIYIHFTEGTFKVEVFSAPGCSTFSDDFNFILPAVDDLSDIQSFRLSPNPFTDYFEYEIHLATTKKIKLAVLDATGKVVWKKELQGPFQKTEIVEMSHLPKGVYFFKAEVDGQQAASPMVKL